MQVLSMRTPKKRQFGFGEFTPQSIFRKQSGCGFIFFGSLTHFATLRGENATMIAVVQRVTHAGVTVEDPPYSAKIGCGLCVLLGIEEGDDVTDSNWMAKKLAHLRIFKDSQDKMNLSLIDNGGELLLISQFTLAGDCSQGNRPSFIRAASPEIAEPLVTEVGDLLQEQHSISVTLGKFGAMMHIDLVNDGPVTVVIRRE